MTVALKASPDDQALLLEVQQLDTRLQQLDHRSKSLPALAQLAELAREEEQLRKTLAQQRGGAEDARAELKRVESDVAVVEARIARDSDRLQHSSSTKDVHALEQELASLRKRLSDLEDIELTVMERVEQEQDALSAAEGRLAELRERVVALEAERDEQLKGLESERVHARANRATVAGKIPPELMALYERQRSRYGVGASHLRGGVSGASGVRLTESDMARIRSAAPDEVILCPDSDAILVRTAESGL
ncbi:zinc ribbon domain-containing protein [Lysobacter korlensis]|uniref:Zinc ribbon domain-containing protein n=1 Tax=Lysobacter korlensis TaxID=553636 RepID=A0ABV6RME4_9GAMM